MPALDGEVLPYFRAMLREHVALDNLLGPRDLLDVVGIEAHQLAVATRGARGVHRRDLLDVTCRYHEFLGWLFQDAGNPVVAMQFSDRAMYYAIELDDPMINAYLLMRKSNIATDAGSPDLALGMVDAALRREARLPPRLHAVVLRQNANAHAALGEPTDSGDAIARAYDLVDEKDPESAELASYCTASYLEMEAAACWIQLDRPDRAVAVLQRGLVEQAPSQRRDKGLLLARLATADASIGEVESACAAGGQAVRIASSTGSARTTRELLQLRHRLKPWKRREMVSGLSQEIGSLAGRAT